MSEKKPLAEAGIDVAAEVAAVAPVDLPSLYRQVPRHQQPPDGRLKKDRRKMIEVDDLPGLLAIDLQLLQQGVAGIGIRLHSLNADLRFPRVEIDAEEIHRPLVARLHPILVLSHLHARFPQARRHPLHEQLAPPQSHHGVDRRQPRRRRRRLEGDRNLDGSELAERGKVRAVRVLKLKEEEMLSSVLAQPVDVRIGGDEAESAVQEKAANALEEILAGTRHDLIVAPDKLPQIDDIEVVEFEHDIIDQPVERYDRCHVHAKLPDRGRKSGRLEG